MKVKSEVREGEELHHGGELEVKLGGDNDGEKVMFCSRMNLQFWMGVAKECERM